MSERLLQIGELATLTGKTARALHLYEERSLIAPARRSGGGFRLYDRDNVARIQYIDRLQQLGASLGEISALVQEWEAGKSPREAMAQVETAYRARLVAVRQKVAELSSLALELERSLMFLEGCHDCGEKDGPHAACGCCERSGAHDEELTLIVGLAGHGEASERQ